MLINFRSWFIRFTCIIFIGIFCISCHSDQDENDSDTGYSDGRYCATVEYYYAETGTSSTYTLEVEIEDNELVKIYWPNGGWLDHHHFDTPDISDGYAEFTSDQGMDYKVTIEGKESECKISRGVDDEDDVIRVAKEKKEAQSEQIRREKEDEEEQAQRDEEDARQEQDRRKREEEREDQEKQKSEEENSDGTNN